MSCILLLIKFDLKSLISIRLFTAVLSFDKKFYHKSICIPEVPRVENHCQSLISQVEKLYIDCKSFTSTHFTDYTNISDIKMDIKSTGP